jgi:hypothetical protein
MSSKRVTMSVMACLAAAACVALMPGCSGDDGGERGANLAPDTFISFGPDQGSRTYFKVQFYWYGTDGDGTVSRFQVATVPDITLDSLENLDFDQLHYATTAATESTFVLPADSCCSSSGTAQLALSYWGLAVRAVDNIGVPDPTPATLFFQASNVVPKVKVTIPRKYIILAQTATSNQYFEWRGSDADGDISRMWYKYIISAVKKSDYTDIRQIPPALPPIDYVYTQPKAPNAVTPEGYWSDWVPPDCTYVKDANLSSFIERSKEYYCRFAVTCRDEGGAALPEPLYGDLYNSNNNWVMMIILAQGSGVDAYVDAGALGRRHSWGEAEYKNSVAGLFEGTQVQFKFWGSEKRDEGKLVREYRYYYDDPEDPRTSTWNYWTSTEPLRDKTASPEWLVRYPSDGSTFVPTLGPHVFALELRDLSKEVTHCEFRLEVLQGPVGKPNMVYLVDDDIADWMSPRYQWSEQGSDSLWAAVLDPYDREIFDTGSNPASPHKIEVPVRRIADATTVIWDVDQDPEDPRCQLTSVCYERGNYLNSYVKVGGNLIIIGRDPIFACQFWPDRTPDVQLRSQATSLDLRPKISETSGDTMYNFNWEIFGIEKMAQVSPDIPTKELWPCEEGWPALRVQSLPGVEGWNERLDNIYFVTQVRTDMPVPVQTIYGVVPLEADGTTEGTPDCGTVSNGRWAGIYVPAHDGRGNAVYLSFPPWFFDHDQFEVLIQKLLDMFGEPRTD